MISLVYLFINVIYCSLSSVNFELDGDATSTLLEDWDTLYLGGGTANSYSGVKTDPSPFSIFRTGGSKDTNDIPQWMNHDSSVPDKDDITNAYAAAYVQNNTVYILFGADRFANNGDAAVGFWFFQDSVNVVSNGQTGSFTGQHKNGDLLVISNFGNTQEILVYVWNNGNLDLLLSDANARCDSSLSQMVCAITNDNPTNSPWPYVPKAGVPGTFPHTSFIEGGIDLTELFNGSDLPCFTTFLAVSRSSTSLTAQLKDFVLNEFKLCGVDISLDCHSATINDNKETVDYEVDITVTNDGFGNLYDLNVTYNNVVIHTEPVLAPSASFVVSTSFSTVDQSPDAGSASVVAALTQGATGDQFIDATADPDTCPFIPLVPSVVTSISCDNTTIDQINEQYVYDYSIMMENTGFGSLITSEASVLSTLLGDLTGLVLKPVSPNNVHQSSRTFTSLVPIDKFTFETVFVDFRNNYLDDSTQSQSCPVVPTNPDLTPTKDCDVSLVPLDGKLVVHVNVTGSVCNTGDIKLKNILVTDDFGTLDTSDDLSIPISELFSGECSDFQTSYFPDSTDGSYVFNDTITATSDAILDLGSTLDTASASCDLCV